MKFRDLFDIKMLDFAVVDLAVVGARIMKHARNPIVTPNAPANSSRFARRLTGVAASRDYDLLRSEGSKINVISDRLREKRARIADRPRYEVKEKLL